MTEAPILIVGVARCGSTWLGGMLASHPQAQVFKDQTAPLYLFNGLRTLSPLADDRLNLSGLEWKAAWLRRYYARQHIGKQQILLSPTYVGFLPLLLAAFPASKIIELQRSPLDSVVSMQRFMEVRQPLRPARRGKRHRRTQAWQAAHLLHRWRWQRWLGGGYLGLRPEGFHTLCHLPSYEFAAAYYHTAATLLASGLAALPPARRYVATFENLAQRFEPEMQSLLKFAGLAAPPDWLQGHKRRVRWRGLHRAARTLTPAQAARLQEIVENGI